MIKSAIDMEAVLAPIPGDNPSGEDLRYSGVYEEIKEARKEDDLLDQGDWQSDLKKADWDRVIKVAANALTEKSKDLQIAVWLTEALIRKNGFSGLASGLAVIGSLISDFWDTLYPLPDEGDLEYRIGPLEFLNDKLSSAVRSIPITDPSSTKGFAWYQWQESRQNSGEGKVTADEFNSAAGKTLKKFYEQLSSDLDACRTIFNDLDAVIDEKFGQDAPGLSVLNKAIEDCQEVVNGIFRDKGGNPASTGTSGESGENVPVEQAAAGGSYAGQAPSATPVTMPAGTVVLVPNGGISDQGMYEGAVWQDAQDTLNTSGIKPALEKLLNASCSAPSPRQQNRYRLMISRLALKADRPDIARPILEELYALISEFRLEQWESPLWIAEVIEAYYQCLTREGAPDDDIYKANGELYPKLCSKDITKALQYKKGG